MLSHIIETASPLAIDVATAGLVLPAPILAIVYGAGEEADPILARLADWLQVRGFSVVGLVQRNPEVPGGSRCNMEVEILPGGERLLISEDRGSGARGCRLDPGLLLGALAQAQARLDAGADLLILNRFGKLEAEGSGGRDLMTDAVAQAVPVVVAVPWRNIDAFRSFAGDFAAEMPLLAFEDWAQELLISSPVLPATIVPLPRAMPKTRCELEDAISFDNALSRIADAASPLASENVSMAAAAGRILTEPLRARNAAPRQAVAAMDGYAVVDAATRPGMPIRVIGEAFAGVGFSRLVGAGEAVRIFTGAALPNGADRCIMQEYARRDGETVSFEEGYGPGWHVRGAGSDFAAGAVLLHAGTRLSPRAMVTAAAADVAALEVRRRPRVAIIGTGTELAAPGLAHTRAYAIPESVTFGVAAMAEAAGAQIVSRQTGMDCLSTLEGLADDALTLADIVVVTGGASVGERDFAKSMFATNGLELVFAKVAIKPGQPVWVGRSRGKWILGLPGNPTSAMVTARLFLLPLVARLQGQTIAGALHWRRMPLAAALPRTGNRETFVRARWDDVGLIPLGNQQSAAQAALVNADWLIRCPAGQADVAAGAMVNALLF